MYGMRMHAAAEMQSGMQDYQVLHPTQSNSMQHADKIRHPFDLYCRDRMFNLFREVCVGHVSTVK